ncbi:hypothetical protein KC361_g9120 [Hortaea werneckii]|nr:hypothetical protein KC361_g9120 [Hortaea werneckii]
MAAAVREELLHTGKDSDLIIRSEGRDFNVHKVIVSAASPVLDRACNNGLLESHTGIIEHNEFDVDTVERMVEYVYKTNYQLPTAPTIRVPSHMPGKTGARDELTVIGTNAKLIMHTRRLQQDLQSPAIDGFIYVVREINAIVLTDETGVWGITRGVCFRNIAKLMNDGFFVTAMASFPDLQEFTALLLHQVIKTKEKLKQKLKHKNATIRRIKKAHQ